jgi:hypothetical protein
MQFEIAWGLFLAVFVNLRSDYRNQDDLRQAVLQLWDTAWPLPRYHCEIIRLVQSDQQDPVDPGVDRSGSTDCHF